MKKAIISLCVSLALAESPLAAIQVSSQQSATEPAEPPKLTEARELGASRDLHNTHRLLALLKDHDERVRLAAAEWLGFLLNKYAVGPGLSLGGEDYHPLEYLDYKITAPFLVSGYRSALLHALSDPSPRVRAATLKALGSIFQSTGGKEGKDAPEDVSRAILPFLNDSNDDLASAAADAVNEIKIREAIPELMRLLERPNPDVRLKALYALNWTNISRPNREVPFVALQKDTSPFFRLLKDPETKVRGQGSTSLDFMCQAGLCDASTVPPLVDALQDAPTRYGAVEALLYLNDPRTVQPVLAVLDEDAAGHAEILSQLLTYRLPQFLKFLGEPEAVNTMLGYLKNGAPEARAATAGALPQAKDERILPALLAILNDPVPLVRIAAIDALDSSSDPRVMPSLIQKLQDADDRVAFECVRKINFRGDLRALEPLVELLHRQNRDIQMLVIDGLPKFKDPRAINALMEVVEDPNSEFRGRAVTSLCVAGDPQGLPAVRRYRDDLLKAGDAYQAGWYRTCIEQLEAASRGDR